MIDLSVTPRYYSLDLTEHQLISPKNRIHALLLSLTFPLLFCKLGLHPTTWK